MNILFLHGLQSSPNSYKRRMIETEGHSVYAPALPADDWERSVKIAREAVEIHKPDLIIGSSRGGAVAMATHSKVPMILVAPAWAKYAPWETISGNTVIIHSEQDEVVDYRDSKDLAHMFGAKLITAGETHRMNDTEALSAIFSAINEAATGE